MSYRKLSALPLDDHIKTSLSKTHLRTVKDVLLLSPLSVMNLLHLSADQCRHLKEHLFSLCVPPRLTAYEMEATEQHNSIPLGSTALDSFLHGGLLSGSLTEFVGPPGVGKTQWCLDITAGVVAGSRGIGKGRGEEASPSVIYIDTESAVRPERLVEMLLNKRPELSTQIPELLSRVFVFRPKTAAAMQEILDSLECVVVERDARVVVVDSVASMAASLSASSVGVRSSHLSSWASKLKSLAHQLSICVVVTNQITTVQQPQQEEQAQDRREQAQQEESVLDVTDLLPHPEDQGDSAGSGRSVVPALGTTWTHCITTRLILQYKQSSARQIVIAKSPVSPFAAFQYTITAQGISIQERDGYYSYSGPDPGLFRITTQEGTPMHTH